MTRRDWMGPALIASVALLALAASITSIGHDFTFDDRYVILANEHVHALKGMWRLFGETYWPRELGGDGYRPLVMSLFTLQWVAGGGAPWVFHLVNIVLAVGAALAVQWCAAAILPPVGAWIAAALFAVHPVHVEATGNVVGQSELLVAICVCLAVGIYLRARRTGPLRPRTAAAILGLYVLGLLSKEHAIVLPLLLGAAEWTVIRDTTPLARNREMRLFALLLVVISAAFLLVVDRLHGGSLGFDPHPAFRYTQMSNLDRIATMMLVMPRIARLLVFPTHLSGDYSPPDVPLANGLDVMQLPGVFICLGVVLLAIAFRRKSPVVSFGLCWMTLAFLPVSNLLMPGGFIVAERTLFLPSVGVVLVAGAIVARVYERGRRQERWIAGAVTMVLLTLGVARSIDRQRVWKNNSVFFDVLVQDVPNSYRAHFLRARTLGAENRLIEAEQEHRTAMRLFPYDVYMMLAIAADYHRVGACSLTNALIQWSYVVVPQSAHGRYAYVECLAHEHRWADSRTEALKAMAFVPDYGVRRLRRAVVRADSVLGRGYKRRGHNP